MVLVNNEIITTFIVIPIIVGRIFGNRRFFLAFGAVAIYRRIIKNLFALELGKILRIIPENRCIIDELIRLKNGDSLRLTRRGRRGSGGERLWES